MEFRDGLLTFDKPLVVETQYMTSNSYVAYQRFVSEILPRIVNDTVVSDLREIIDRDSAFLCEMPRDLEIRKFGSYNNSNTQSVVLKFRIQRLDKKMESFIELFRLPAVDRYGVIRENGKVYSPINILNIEPFVTYDEKLMRFSDERNSFVIEDSIQNGPRVTIYKNKYPLLLLMSMMLYREFSTLDALGTKPEVSSTLISALKRMSDADIKNAIKTKDSIIKLSELESYDEIREFCLRFAVNTKFIDVIKNMNDRDGFLSSEVFRCSAYREDLNELVSLRNVVGRVLAEELAVKDYLTGTGITLKPGHCITDYDYRCFTYSLIDSVKVKSNRSLIGKIYSGRGMSFNVLPIGTPIFSELRDKLPTEMKGYDVLPKTVSLPPESPVVIHNGREIDVELDEFFRVSGMDVLYRDSKASKHIWREDYTDTYFNNRRFEVKYLPEGYRKAASDSATWLYVNVNGIGHEDMDEYLNYADLLAIFSIFKRASRGQDLHLFADPDYSLKKILRQVDFYVEEAYLKAYEIFSKGGRINSIAKMILDSVDTDSLNDSGVSEKFVYLSTTFHKILFNEMGVIGVVDYTNPPAFMSSITHANALVKDGNSIKDSQRVLTMAHYGRICPYEVPQSKKLGIVNNLAHIAKVDSKGRILSPYHKVIHKDDGSHYVDPNVEYLTIAQDEKYRIGDLSQLTLDGNGKIISHPSRMKCRIPAPESLEKITYGEVPIESVDYVNVSNDQHASWAIMPSPFVGANDAARVSFGASMVKQSKPLIDPEIPYVITSGFYNIPNATEFFKVHAEGPGTVKAVTGNFVAVQYDDSIKVVKYDFVPLEYRNKAIVQRNTVVSEGDRVKLGDTLVTSNFIKDGVMATGVNALVAYVIDGYNYEDGVPISERLSSKLTSYGMHKEEVVLPSKFTEFSVTGLNYDRYRGVNSDTPFCNWRGISLTRGLSKDQTVDEIRVNSKSAGTSGSILAHKCIGYPLTANSSVDSTVNTGLKQATTSATCVSVSFDRFTVSDKVCNRHGNKGVSCRVFKNSAMFYLNNGEFVDIIYNPLGIIGRMNVGQILEAHIGLAAMVLNIRVLCDPFDSPQVKTIALLVRYAHDLANSKPGHEENVFREYSMLPESLHSHCRDNMSFIRNWANTFDEYGLAYVYDTRSGKYSYTKAVIGVNYVYKTIHEGLGKLHARGGPLSRERYLEKTMSPTKGASKGGGQRQGYMELDAYAAYGVSNLIREYMNERGDNPVARREFTEAIMLHKSPVSSCTDPKAITDRRSVDYMFHLLRALGIDAFEDGEAVVDKVHTWGNVKFLETELASLISEIGSDSGLDDDDDYDDSDYDDD